MSGFRPTCGRCGDLNPADARKCEGCGTALYFAEALSPCQPEVTPAYGVRRDGSFGVRGWRMWCPSCGKLDLRVFVNQFGARAAVVRHRKQSRAAA